MRLIYLSLLPFISAKPNGWFSNFLNDAAKLTAKVVGNQVDTIFHHDNSSDFADAFVKLVDHNMNSNGSNSTNQRDTNLEILDNTINLFGLLGDKLMTEGMFDFMELMKHPGIILPLIHESLELAVADGRTSINSVDIEIRFLSMLLAVSCDNERAYLDNDMLRIFHYGKIFKSKKAIEKAKKTMECSVFVASKAFERRQTVNTEVTKIFGEVDRNGDGKIWFPEFKYFTRKIKEKLGDSSFSKAFNDSSFGDRIDKEQVKSICDVKGTHIRMTDNGETNSNGVHIIVVIDESSSMSRPKWAMIDNFNTFLSGQKSSRNSSETVRPRFTQVQFRNSFVARSYASIDDVPELTYLSYTARGSTALYDTLACTMEMFQNEMQNIMVIITDDVDNASRHFNSKEIQSKLEDFSKKNAWDFSFIDANSDAFKVGPGLVPDVPSQFSFPSWFGYFKYSASNKEQMKETYDKLTKRVIQKRHENFQKMAGISNDE